MHSYFTYVAACCLKISGHAAGLDVCKAGKGNALPGAAIAASAIYQADRSLLGCNLRKWVDATANLALMAAGANLASRAAIARGHVSSLVAAALQVILSGLK